MLKSAIGRGYFTAPGRQALGPQFKPVFTELAVVGGLVVQGSRIVVPSSLRDKVVRLAHEGHQGVTKNKRISQDQGLVSRFGPDGGSPHSALPPMSSSDTSK